MMPQHSPTSLIDALVSSLRACAAAPDGMVRPAAILWPDPERQWLPLKAMLLQRLPEFIVLGQYSPASRTGPAIWIRCVIDRTLEDPKIPEDDTPIVYLPGVSLHELRAGDDCRSELKPLVELMYRGTMWLHPGGREWTVRAFLTSPRGLGLDVAKDQGTRAALLRALREVAEVPIAQFQGRRLEAGDFDRLLAADVVRDLLRWMNDPAVARERMSPERWVAFRNQCQAKFALDPERDGEITAGERLGLGEGPWAEAWERFEEAPAAYPGIVDLLRRSKPNRLLFDPSRWPGLNDEAEETVRAELASLQNLPHGEACTKVLALEQAHAERRQWVWARLGHSPMAMALEYLARLARLAQSALGGSTPDEIADRYVEGAWEADAASWEVVAQASITDEELIKSTVRILLGPWLDESAYAFQRAVAAHPLPGHGEQELVHAAPGGCILFADGLRYDLGCRLAEKLEARGCRVSIRRRWAALPTVTATAKPAVSPVAGDIAGGSLPEDFCPSFTSSGKPAGAATLRSAIQAGGYQVLGEPVNHLPSAEETRGWIEAGIIDTRGHDLQDDLPRHIEQELERLAERILCLLDAGWASVRVVTDHGWLLLPGGMPKVELPKHLTESRWKRCAVIAGESQVDALTLPWYWNAGQRFATAPGIACFNASPSYAHGGVSVQECLVPDLLVERGTELGTRATITGVTWRGMRCFIEARSTGGRVIADLRLEGPNGKSVVASTKSLDADGTANLVVADDAYEHANLVLVLVDEAGNVLAQLKTRVGVSS